MTQNVVFSATGEIIGIGCPIPHGDFQLQIQMAVPMGILNPLIVYVPEALAVQSKFELGDLVQFSDPLSNGKLITNSITRITPDAYAKYVAEFNQSRLDEASMATSMIE